MNKGKNCPNCGASIKHIYSHNCPYCKTLLNSENIGTRQDINLRNVRNIELISVERGIERYSIYLIFKGIESDIRPMFEVSSEKAIVFNKMQDVKFGLEISLLELEERNIFELIETRLPNEILDEVLYATQKFLSNSREYEYLLRFC